MARRSRKACASRRSSSKAGAPLASSPMAAPSAATSSSTAPGSGRSASARWPACRSPPASSSISISSPKRSSTLDADLTTLRDPGQQFLSQARYRQPSPSAAGRTAPKGCWRGMPPLDFGRELFAPNMDRLELFALPAAERLPVLNEIGIQTVINGPIPVSSDGEPIMGLAPRARQFLSRLRLHRRHCRVGRRRAGYVEYHPCTAMPAWISGPSTCAASARCMRRAAISKRAPSRPMAPITRSIGRPRNRMRAVACGVRRCTQRCAGTARSSARNSAGSGPTGLRWKAAKPRDWAVFEGKPNWFDAVRPGSIAPSASARR